jgi:hypothetical protein
MEYEIDFAPALLAQVRQMLDAAQQAGNEAVLRAFRDITARLQANPLDFGEPRYSLQHPGATVRVGVLGPIAVQFAVYSVERRVWVLRVVALSGQEN